MKKSKYSKKKLKKQKIKKYRRTNKIQLKNIQKLDFYTE